MLEFAFSKKNFYNQIFNDDIGEMGKMLQTKTILDRTPNTFWREQMKYEENERHVPFFQRG